MKNLKKSMNHLKGVLKKLTKTVKSLDLSNPLELAVVLLFLGFPLTVGVLSFSAASPENDPRQASVMIVNSTMSHGGTGIILKSGPTESEILTNEHVCRAIEKGGIVRSKTGDYQITALKKSQTSDLCIVAVAANLGVNTAISKTAPQFYEKATVSGHPSLMPNVITEGHYSGRKIISVLMGMRKCTEEDLKSDLGIICFFFGGIPMVKNYESMLVTATIMPGSSGSGVYNSKKELSSVVFAGQGGIGYAWVVPYEQLVNFVKREAPRTEFQLLDQSVSFNKEEETKMNKDIRTKCLSLDLKQEEVSEQVKEVCEILARDVTWMK